MLKELIFAVAISSVPLAALAAPEPVVRITGILGDLRLSAGYIRADVIDVGNEGAQLAIAMNHEASALFANFTMLHDDQVAAFSICEAHQQPLPITKDAKPGFVLTGVLSQDMAQMLAAVINDERSCPTTSAS